jgi:hypothetical protein
MPIDRASILADLVDPRRPAWHGACPFCGATIALGFRPNGGNFAVHHSAVPDPLKPGAWFVACDRFTELAPTNQAEFFRLLAAAGFRAYPLTG